MLTFLEVDGLNCPIVVCDWCGKRIEKAGDGNCEWYIDEQAQPVSGKAVDHIGRPIAGILFFTHKYCTRPCEKRNGFSQSRDLDAFLFELEHNCPFDRDRARQMSDLVMRL